MLYPIGYQPFVPTPEVNGPSLITLSAIMNSPN
jgi:hypothetical protein